MINTIKRNGVFVIISIFISIYFELYRELRAYYITKQFFDLLNNEFNLRILAKLFLFFIIALVILLLINHFKHIFIYIDKYRYIIGGAIILICTIFELSGSSIGNYYNYLGNQYHTSEELFQQGTLLGIPREIRTDEWATLTPFNFAQQFNDYNSTSDILRGYSTDVTTFYANPSFALATLFRPFLWGYIILGNAKGLAFFWSARTVSLFLVMYELGKLLTKNKKVISASFAALITFSQTIQWWYSTNGLIEMFIFGGLAIILLDLFLQSDKLWKKALLCLGLIGCAGGYLLVYYPAQQVPLGYIFGVLAIYILVTNRKLIKLQDILLIIGTVIIFAACIACIIYNSLDTIQATMNTVYPGKRVNSGGGTNFIELFTYITSIFTPIDGTNLIVEDNVSELSVFYSMFPFGILCSVYSMIRRKKADLLYILLIAVELLFIIYCLFGLPTIIAKITFLSYSFSRRIMEILGFIDIILLTKFLSEDCEPRSKRKSIVSLVAIIISIVGILIAVRSLYLYGLNPPNIIWIVVTVLIIWIAYLILRNTSDHKEKLAITLICIITISGLAVNPLQRGADVIYNNSIVQDVAKIRSVDSDALWIVISERSQVNNIPIMVGAKTINSTNTYPNMNTWHKIDPSGQYESIYNRYAHIHMDISENETVLTLNAPDSISVKVNQSDLEKLNVSYILSDKELTSPKLTNLYTNNNYYIYKVL